MVNGPLIAFLGVSVPVLTPISTKGPGLNPFVVYFTLSFSFDLGLATGGSGLLLRPLNFCFFFCSPSHPHILLWTMTQTRLQLKADVERLSVSSPARASLGDSPTVGRSVLVNIDRNNLESVPLIDQSSTDFGSVGGTRQR